MRNAATGGLPWPCGPRARAGGTGMRVEEQGEVGGEGNVVDAGDEGGEVILLHECGEEFGVMGTVLKAEGMYILMRP